MDPNCYEIKCREYVAKIRELNETEQYRNETNLDKDAVATVLGTDNRGFVRGMGCGISKTELLASAVPREQLRQQVLKTRAVEDRVRTLEVAVETLMAGLSCNPSTSNVNAQIEEVCLESEGLCDFNGTFKDVKIGEKILWPQHYVCPIATDGDGF